MKTLAELQSAVDEIAEVCRRHGIVLVGSCKSEGIHGEIRVVGAADFAAEQQGWSEHYRNVWETDAHPNIVAMAWNNESDWDVGAIGMASREFAAASATGSIPDSALE